MSVDPEIAVRASPVERADFLTDGVATFKNWVSSAELELFVQSFPELGEREPGARACDFSQQAQDWIAHNEKLRHLAGFLIGKPAQMSRLQAFDKSERANWFVPWHQDRAEAGRDRPIGLLHEIVALRIHLDDCGADNGPLEVLPRTHLAGRLEAGAISALVAATEPIVCLAGRGDVIAMRPLLLHRSQRAKVARARRVIHIEYSPN